MMLFGSFQCNSMTAEPCDDPVTRNVRNRYASWFNWDRLPTFGFHRLGLEPANDVLHVRPDDIDNPPCRFWWNIDKIFTETPTASLRLAFVSMIVKDDALFSFMSVSVRFVDYWHFEMAASSPIVYPFVQYDNVSSYDDPFRTNVSGSGVHHDNRLHVLINVS